MRNRQSVKCFFIAQTFAIIRICLIIFLHFDRMFCRGRLSTLIFYAFSLRLGNFLFYMRFLNKSNQTWSEYACLSQYWCISSHGPKTKHHSAGIHFAKHYIHHLPSALFSQKCQSLLQSSSATQMK